MPRKWPVDDDGERLPEGVRRTGYDADTQTYTYEGADGTTYTGRPGQRFGELTRTGGPSQIPRPTSSASSRHSQPQILANEGSLRKTPSPSSTYSTPTTPDDHTNSSSGDRRSPQGTPPSSSSSPPFNARRNKTFSAILDYNTTTTTTSTPTSSIPAATHAATYPLERSSKQHNGPTVGDAAKELSRSTGSLFRELSLWALLALSKRIRKRAESIRAARERKR